MGPYGQAALRVDAGRDAAATADANAAPLLTGLSVRCGLIRALADITLSVRTLDEAVLAAFIEQIPGGPLTRGSRSRRREDPRQLGLREEPELGCEGGLGQVGERIRRAGQGLLPGKHLVRIGLEQDGLPPVLILAMAITHGRRHNGH